MIKKMRRINCVHFVGIGGSGMSGIAEVMLSLGYEVQGSDLNSNNQTERLENLGARIYIGHSSENIKDADAIVVSSAVEDDNPEIIYAKKQLMPVVSRAEMLAELMRFRYSVAVSGTHGKTTTTSLIASILAEGGLDPTFVIGGRLKSADTNARLGQGEYLVAEADESDASFIHLKPMLAVVTNIDADHMSTYDGDIEKLKKSFIKFLRNLPFYGLAVICIDDLGVNDVIHEIRRSVISYGINDDADIRATNIVFNASTTEFDVVKKSSEDILHIKLRLPGLHNVRNALAAIAVADELQVSNKVIIKSLSKFEGIDRRFQLIGNIETESGTVMLVDDYGHHPTEIEATLAAAKSGWPGKRIILIFQPHRYSRTQDLMDDFVNALSEVDVLILLDVYAAGEEPIPGADGRALAKAIRTRASIEPIFADSFDNLQKILLNLIKDGDFILTMGAGDISSYVSDLPNLLKKTPSSNVSKS